MQGYAHPDYVASLAEFGDPVRLADCEGWLLRRTIPDSPRADAMGPYPFFTCRDWRRLPEDLDRLDGLVSVMLVADPFGDHDAELLSGCFPDLLKPYKDQFVADLSRSPETFVSRHHRRYARAALSTVDVKRAESPIEWLDDWTGLYEVLVERHGIRGVAAFSRQSFAAQLEVPGMVAYGAIHQGRIVGMLLWYERGSVASYHLGAFSDEGYRLKCSFALFWHALNDLASRDLRWAHLGAGAGVASGAQSGLTEFKQGWSTTTRRAWLCGRIYDREAYDELARLRGSGDSGRFPSYRSGEFESGAQVVHGG